MNEPEKTTIPEGAAFERITLAAWWDRDGLNLRKITLDQAASQRSYVLCSLTWEWENFRVIDGVRMEIYFRTLVYVFRTRYLEPDPSTQYGLRAPQMDFLRMTIGHFLDHYWMLSPRKQTGLDLLWARAEVLDVFPYKTDRHFRDCESRAVNDALHEAGFDFDLKTMAWKERS